MDTCRATAAGLTAACRVRAGAFAGVLAISLAALLAVERPAAAQATDLPGLAARVIDAVVNISMVRRVEADPATGEPARLQRGAGSGFVIDAAGIIVTNEHVVRGAEQIAVTLNDGTRLPAELLGEDSYIDVAVLRVRPAAPLATVKFADSDRIRVGEPVMAIGNPSGLGGTVTAGIVSARDRDIRMSLFDNFIQTDTAINRGNSGGPLFNMAGDVIGINTLGLSPSGGSIGLNFAVPANTAQPIVAQLREFGETRRGWLGVHLQDLTSEVAEALRVDPPRGVIVSGLYPRGPAGPAGMRSGDVIVGLNGREIRDSRQLQRIVAETSAGATVPVTVLRDGRSMELTVTLARREAPGPGAPVASVLGMELSGITPALRSEHGLPGDARGVVVTAVSPGSPAARQGIRPGLVIAEVHNAAVDTPGDFLRRVEALKAEGRRSAVFLVRAANGQMRLIALNLA